VSDAEEAINSEIPLAVAAAIQSIRRAEGWTLDELADRSGLHRTTIGLVERGERLLSISSAAQIARAFEMPLSELISYAEREIAVVEHHLERIATTKLVPGATKRLVDPSFIDNEETLKELLGVGAETVVAAIEETYDTLDLIDDELRAKGSPPVSGLVELANLSSMIGNLLGAGFANASGGNYARNRPHAFPDLVPLRPGLPQLEMKMALESNSPKGHLAKAGTYITFRYVLADRDGKYEVGASNRGDTAWVWEVRCGHLDESDFAISNTPGDSGKTAVIKGESFKGMTRIYYSPAHLPYKRRNTEWGDGG